GAPSSSGHSSTSTRCGPGRCSSPRWPTSPTTSRSRSRSTSATGAERAARRSVQLQRRPELEHVVCAEGRETRLPVARDRQVGGGEEEVVGDAVGDRGLEGEDAAEVGDDGDARLEGAVHVVRLQRRGDEALVLVEVLEVRGHGRHAQRVGADSLALTRPLPPGGPDPPQPPLYLPPLRETR